MRAAEPCEGVRGHVGGLKGFVVGEAEVERRVGRGVGEGVQTKLAGVKEGGVGLGETVPDLVEGRVVLGVRLAVVGSGKEDVETARRVVG